MKTALSQSKKAIRDVYVISSRECKKGSFYLLSGLANYGLVKANAKWQIHFDTNIMEVVMTPAVLVPQLFYLRMSRSLNLIVAKIVDDNLNFDQEEIRQRSNKKLCKIYTVGTIVNLPGSFNFFGLRIEQNIDFQINISAEEKLSQISPYVLTRPLRKNLESDLTAVELFTLQSVNGSLHVLD